MKTTKKYYLKVTQYNEKIKNGIIEFYRFVFCLVVVFHHSSKFSTDSFAFSRAGSIGVEFFFVVSGYLMAKTIYGKVAENKEILKSEALASETVQFIKSKIRRLCPNYYIAWTIAFAFYQKFPNTETQIKELKDLKIGIIGFGSVGRLVAEKMKALGCEILISTPHISENAYDLLNFNFVALDTLLEESDVISLHARADSVIIGEREFSLMKPTAYFINTARSILVDSSSLENALRRNKILGAAIDVFESEPNIATFYRDLDNVTVTNHRGGDTINSYKDAPIFAMKNYFNYLKGGKMKFWINKKYFINE